MASETLRSRRYPFGWHFRRDWKRAGIPWFVLPASQTTAEMGRYNQHKLEFVRDLLERTSKKQYLCAILSRLLWIGASQEQKLEAIVRFVQRATWHNPLECPFEGDGKTIVSNAHELLELHDARCWHTAEVVRQLCEAAGMRARITFLPGPYNPSVHVVAEVRIGDDWLVADANYFKSGVILRTPAGNLPTIPWLLRHPHYPDCFPGGWVFPAEFLTNAASVTVKGQFSLPFEDAEDTWGSEARYSSYLGQPEWFPPTRPVGLRVDRIGRKRYSLTWHASRSHSARWIRYDVILRRERAGAVWKITDIDSTQVCLPELSPGVAYKASVTATDEQREASPRIWYPSKSISFVAGK